MPDLRPLCRFCSRPWTPPEGVDATLHYCPSCSEERRAHAKAVFDNDGKKSVAHGRYVFRALSLEGPLESLQPPVPTAPEVLLVEAPREMLRVSPLPNERLGAIILVDHETVKPVRKRRKHKR